MQTHFRPRLRFRLATLADLALLESLRRRHSMALGFLSLVTLQDKIRTRRVRLALLEGEPVGFVLHGSLRGPEVRIFQLAVQPVARGLGVGRSLVQTMVRIARRAGAAGVSLRCRDRLEANAFWLDVGFVLQGLEPARQGALCVWVCRLDKIRSCRGAGERAASDDPDDIGTLPFQFHSRWRRCPQCGQPTCGSWSAGSIHRNTCPNCATARNPHAERTARIESRRCQTGRRTSTA